MARLRKRKSRRMAMAQARLELLPDARVPAPSWVTPERRWYAVAIRPVLLARAIRDIEKAGLKVFSPTVVATQIRCRRHVRFPRPLFPGYVFVSPDDGAYVTLDGLEGVRGYLGMDRPLEVPWPALRRVVDYLAAPVDVVAKVPAIGDIVRVMAGPMEGRNITVVGHASGGVLADGVIGRVMVPLGHVESIAA